MAVEETNIRVSCYSCWSDFVRNVKSKRNEMVSIVQDKGKLGEKSRIFQIFLTVPTLLASGPLFLPIE